MLDKQDQILADLALIKKHLGLTQPPLKPVSQLSVDPELLEQVHKLFDEGFVVEHICKETYLTEEQVKYLLGLPLHLPLPNKI